MGVIKDGTIEGVLPEKVAFAVHYPGYPSSTSRAIETLGGTEGIIKARSAQSNSMELRFRPEDPYSHPAFGELRPCSNLLLKISRKKITADQDAVVSENDQRTCNRGNEPHSKEVAVQSYLSADIVARVSEAYRFNGMVDYQHVLAVHANAAKKRKRHWQEVEPHFEKAGLMDIDQEDLMILVPPLFSLKDVPEKLVLRPSTLLTAKKKQETIVKDRWEMQIEPCLGIEFDIEKIPPKINWEDHIPRGSDHWELQMAVSKLFDERPIWNKLSLYHRLLDEGLKLGAHLLRRLLFRTAYYFGTGPFRRLWIRKGYDPRKDPESRIYQNVDFRVHTPLPNSGDENTDKLEHIWKDLCAFQVFPCKHQTSFQLYDLVDDYIQQEIRKPSEETTCSRQTGWFSSHVYDILRHRISVRFFSVYPEKGADSLLKSAVRRFEKSKRAHALKRNIGQEELEQQRVNRDSDGHASKTSQMRLKDTELVGNDGKDESDDNDDKNAGDDEIEVDEDEEEELDDYEVDGEDGDFNLQPSSHMDEENISKNYLQELFGSFPGRDKVQDADCSDGEYQIFDDNYSDEDDDY